MSYCRGVKEVYRTVFRFSYWVCGSSCNIIICTKVPHIFMICHVVPPPSPANVSTDLSGDFLTVNWSVPTVPDVTLKFIVTLKASEEIRVEINDTQRFQFTISEQMCGPFEVEIIVSNLAGTNKTSVTGLLPVLRESACHEIQVKDDGILLTVKFKVYL